MNNEAKTILWIGFILIVFQVISMWATIKAILFTPGPGSSGGNVPGIPNFPLLPVPVAQQTPQAQTPSKRHVIII